MIVKNNSSLKDVCEGFHDVYMVHDKEHGQSGYENGKLSRHDKHDVIKYDLQKNGNVEYLCIMNGFKVLYFYKDECKGCDDLKQKYPNYVFDFMDVNLDSSQDMMCKYGVIKRNAPCAVILNTECLKVSADKLLAFLSADLVKTMDYDAQDHGGGCEDGIWQCGT